MDDFERRIAVDLAIPQDVVEKVICFGLDEMKDAMREVDSAEISGFGIFYFRTIALPHYIKKYEVEKVKMENKLKGSFLSSKRRENAEKKLELLNSYIAELKKRNEVV